MPEHTHDVADSRHARRWQDAVLLAQVELAERLSRAIAAARFDRHRYQDWLAMESLACRIGALSLDAVAGWHGAEPQARAAADAWAQELRGFAQAAARDVRVLDGAAGAVPQALARWHAFVAEAAGSQRAGEVLGAVLLHSEVFGGTARAMLAAMGSLPFVAPGCDHYLRQRLRADPDVARAPLLDAYATAALAAGAHRAAGWYRDALEEVLASPVVRA